MSRALYIALALAAAGCNQGNELATGVGLDLAQPAVGDGGNLPQDDLAVAVDMTAGKSCGQIVSCVVQCGLTNLTCAGGCVGGADPMAIQEAGALTLCAAQNCLSFSGDGGIDTSGIFQCLIMNCQTQIAGCPGLLPGAM